MIEATAVVVKTTDQQIWITGGEQSACGACQQKASCTTAALDSTFKKKPVPITSALPLNTGDRVLVAIDESVVLRSTLLLYLLPLLALLLGAGLAESLFGQQQHADLWIAASAISSLLLSLYLIHKGQNLGLVGTPPAPVIIKKL
jgi:sigma-E factor negative regulatory protein RseC